MKKLLSSIFTLGTIFLVVALLAGCKLDKSEVGIHYLGHSSFVLSFNNGVDIVTDYGKENAWLEWGWDSPIHSIGDLIPEVMTYSHRHDDHYDPNRIPDGVEHILIGNDSVFIENISITNIRTCESDITELSNSSFIFEYNDLTICHLGDAQAQILNVSDTSVREDILKKFPAQIDLLFMTIEGRDQFIPQAEEFIRLLNPKRVIPMHFWEKKYLDDFIGYIEEVSVKDNIYQITHIQEARYELTKKNTRDIELIILERNPFIVDEQK